MRQKIILISGFYPQVKGGAEYQMRIIADELKKEFEVVFVYLGDVPHQSVEKTSFQMIDGFKVYSVKTVSKYDRFLLQYFYSRRLKKILKAEKPDFVYQRVLKFMSYHISSFQKSVGYTHFIHIADLYSINFGTSLKEKIKFIFFKSTVKNKPKFIIQTNEQSEILKKHGIKPVLQIYNIHPIKKNNLEYFFKIKKANDKKHIVWVANIKPIKQLELLLDVAEKFKNNDNIVFDVIGNVHDLNYGSSIFERMKKLPNVNHFEGKDNVFVNQFLLEKASLVVNTSKNEGFSNVFIQSWLAGIPVLSLNSNPDDLFNKYSLLGSFCDNLIDRFINYIKESKFDIPINNSQEIQGLAEELFSVDSNINKIRNILIK